MKRVPWVIGALIILLMVGMLLGLTMGSAKIEFSRLVSAIY
jgi:predicted transporter